MPWEGPVRLLSAGAVLSRSAPDVPSARAAPRGDTMTCHFCTRRFPVPHREHLGDSAMAVTETVPVVPGAAPPAVEPFEVRIDLGGLHPPDVTQMLEIASTLAIGSAACRERVWHDVLISVGA